MSIGIALAGGGLKGLAHIGALKALDELGVKIDYLSGTSSGCLFASLYAMGGTFDEIKEYTIKYYKMLTTIPKRPVIKAGATYLTSGVARISGLIPGENIENILNVVSKEMNINIKNMNEISLPYAIATVDTISTKECIFLSKDFGFENTNEIDYILNAPIAKATRASMSFPGVYTPCDYDKYNFIDGGTKDNLPVKVLKDMGADKTLALSFRIDDYVPKDDILGVLLRTVDIFSLKDVRKAQKQADLSIEIDCSGTSLLEITDADEVMQKGYDSIMSHKDKILKLLK